MSEAVLRAMELISTHTCIKFSTEPSDVMIRMESDPTQNFCYAEIGHVRPHQKFSFVSACYSSGAAAHELIHSLGFIHTHQRSDRDQYLDFKMNLEDMTPDMRDQYKIYEGQTLYVPYDYGSVMHYPDER